MFYIKNPLLVAYLALIMLYVEIFLPEIISTVWDSKKCTFGVGPTLLDRPTQLAKDLNVGEMMNK